jgi:hypothetical protein
MARLGDRGARHRSSAVEALTSGVRARRPRLWAGRGLRDLNAVLVTMQLLYIMPAVGAIGSQIMLVALQIATVATAFGVGFFHRPTVGARAGVVLPERGAVLRDRCLVAAALVRAQLADIARTLRLGLAECAAFLRNGGVVLAKLRAIPGGVALVLADVAAILANVRTVLLDRLQIRRKRVWSGLRILGVHERERREKRRADGDYETGSAVHG